MNPAGAALQVLLPPGVSSLSANSGGYPESHWQLHRQCRSVVPPAQFAPHAHPSLQSSGDLSYIPSGQVAGQAASHARGLARRSAAIARRMWRIANQPTARTKERLHRGNARWAHRQEGAYERAPCAPFVRRAEVEPRVAGKRA